MSLARSFLEAQDIVPFYSIDPEKVKAAFNKKLDSHGFEDISAFDAEVSSNDEIIYVSFTDGDDVLDVAFYTDQDEDGDTQFVAHILSDDTHPETDHILIDLSMLSPKYVDGHYTKFVDMSDLSWLTKSAFKLILQAGDFINPTSPEPGYEAMKTVVHGGKVQRIAVGTTKKKRKMSTKQRQALARAQQKSHTGQANKNRAKSLKVRQARHL